MVVELDEVDGFVADGVQANGRQTRGTDPRRVTRLGIAAVAAFIAAGCGSDGSLGGAPQDPLYEDQWKLVERAYPFTGEHGEDVCTEWRYIDSKTGETSIDREWYLFEKMNDMLERKISVDDAAAVAAARDGGVAHVATCEDARKFTRLRRESAAREPVEEPDTSESTTNAPDNEEFDLNGPAPRVDKIAFGNTYMNPSTVRLVTVSGNCSGVLINSNALLTAAHCVPSSIGASRYRIAVDYGSAQSFLCISPPDCTLAGSTNAWAFQFDGYSGSGDSAHDLAVVVADSDWTAPANVDTSWSRILNKMTSLADTYYLEGYGWNGNSGGNTNVGRRGVNIGLIDGQTSADWGMNTRQNYSRACKGDSGGPANNQTYMLGKANPGFVPCAIGVVSYAEGVHPYCPSPGEDVFYSRIYGKVSWLESWIGTCYHGSSNGNAYVRCW